MTIVDQFEFLSLASWLPTDIHHWLGCAGLMSRFAARKPGGPPLLAQEHPGFHLGIAPEINATGRHAAEIVREKYDAWLHDRQGETPFKRQHFTIAVGGGNTVKSEYKALLRYHFHDIDWLDHIRFFFLEETCNAADWESAREGLVSSFIKPLAKKLVATRGTREMAEKLGLDKRASTRQIAERLVGLMTSPMDLGGVEEAINRKDLELALERARREAKRYESTLKTLLGSSMSFHMIITGVGKDGGLGAFAPYTPQLKQKTPAVVALKKADGAICVALNRGVLTAAGSISLIVSGSRKLRAIGRFEMEDSADFEQTVMETPIRMLRETRDVAERVYIFADDRALHFDEEAFRYEENGQTLELKAEAREGDEERGIHILLVHGFMGLYSYINLLIRLPSAWKVWALRRGKHAKTLADDRIFPHYAGDLRKIILHNWRSGRPTPICCHSMAGLISDHLLLSVLKDYDDELPDFERLQPGDRQLVEALRTAGIIHIATWAPSDALHLRQNMERRRKRGPREAGPGYPDPGQIYELTANGDIALKQEVAGSLMSAPAVLDKMLALPLFERTINGINVAIRYLAGKVDLQKLLKQREAPYAQRLLGARVLQKVSIYGVLKEMNAAMHRPGEYQERHLKALKAIIKYDIPFLDIVHRDDAMVSVERHIREHDYLLDARMQKEGVKNEQALRVPVRLLVLHEEGEEAKDDLVNAHFVILSRTGSGAGDSRKVTTAMTAFVNSNVARAIHAGRVKPLRSIEEWLLKTE